MTRHGTDSPFGLKVLTEQGRAAVILGGGPSLPRDVDQVPEDAVFISVNEHGCRFVNCDYAVYLDDHVGPRLREFDVVRISQHRDDTEFRLIHFTNPSCSSILAAWVAYMLGCSPIILCGMDCYAGGTYWHDETAESAGNNQTVETHVERWKKYASEILENAETRVVSGPLQSVFDKYDPSEVYPPPKLPSPPALNGREEKLDGVLVRIKRGVVINGETYSPGSTERLSFGMAKYIAQIGKCEIIESEV